VKLCREQVVADAEHSAQREADGARGEAGGENGAMTHPAQCVIFARPGCRKSGGLRRRFRRVVRLLVWPEMDDKAAECANGDTPENCKN
jgi:hypothetical protein